MGQTPLFCRKNKGLSLHPFVSPQNADDKMLSAPFMAERSQALGLCTMLTPARWLLKITIGLYFYYLFLDMVTKGLEG
jgi:hypothetical protein